MIVLLALSLTATLSVQQAQVPTVGDTVWAARTVRVRAGAVVRPAPWPDEPDAAVQPLGAPRLVRHGDTVEIRYPLVVWTTGEHPVEIPGPVLLGPGAAVDSLPPEATSIFIDGVIPDSVDVDSALPQPAAQPLGSHEVSWTPPLEFALLGLALAIAVLHLGGRRQRSLSTPVPAPAPLPDAVRWAASGELRAAQAAAQARLRRSIARAVPAAAERVDIASCLTVLREVRPDWPLLELEGLLRTLDGERFAPAAGDPDLVEQADQLRARLERAG